MSFLDDVSLTELMKWGLCVFINFFGPGTYDSICKVKITHSHNDPESYSSFFNRFIEIYFTFHIIHSLRVYHLAAL